MNLYRFWYQKACILTGVITCCALFIFPPAVFAHRVTVFAWVEGDTIHTESKFSGGKRVVGGTIKVYDSQKQILVEGQTNDQGEFFFKIPGEGPLVVELNAGMGHMAKWTLQPDDLGEESDHALTGDDKDSETEKLPAHSPQVISEPSVSSEELKILIESVMDEKLKPIKKILVESQANDPSLSEILGGVGYIIGLMGMAAYFRYRKGTKDQG